MQTYRAAVVGCGRIGSLWDMENDPPVPLSHAGALSLVPQFKLVAGASRGREHLEAYGRRWGVTALYTDYREMLAKERLDVVTIATHPQHHRGIVEAATAAGVKAIFCEKPMALSLEDADAIVAACRKAGCILSVNHSRRWYPSYLKAKELVQQGAIGELVSLYGMCQGGKPYPAWTADEEGPMLHDGVHLFDLFRLFAGNVKAVMGTALKRKLPFRVEDDAQAIFEFEAGVSAVALVNELTRYSRFEIEVQGTEGMMRLNDHETLLWGSAPIIGHRREPDPRIEWWRLDPRPFPAYPQGQPLLLAIQELAECLETGKTPSSTGEDGVASVEMCMAVYESELRGNARVTLPLQRRKSQLYALREAGKL
jgi:predicted dehydrogenase